MNTVIPMLAVTPVASLGFLAVFVMLLIGRRTEGSQLSPSSASHTRTESVACRILGLYVRREIDKTPVDYGVRG
jgi:hypothetical protein